MHKTVSYTELTARLLVILLAGIVAAAVSNLRWQTSPQVNTFVVYSALHIGFGHVLAILMRDMLNPKASGDTSLVFLGTFIVLLALVAYSVSDSQSSGTSFISAVILPALLAFPISLVVTTAYYDIKGQIQAAESARRAEAAFELSKRDPDWE